MKAIQVVVICGNISRPRKRRHPEGRKYDLLDVIVTVICDVRPNLQ